MKVMLEMRPAFAGHSGIPQETRLLFRGLADVPGIRMVGLLQSGNLVLEPGLPVRGGQVQRSAQSADDVDRLSKVVVSLQQGPASHRIEHLKRRFLQFAGPTLAAWGGLLGMRVALGSFDPQPFQDFVWRSMFAKSLPAQDLDVVTSAEFRVMRWPWSMTHAVGVGSAMLGYAVYPRLDTRDIDVFVAETPYPGRVSRGTQLVVRYHDAVPLFMPHTIKDRGYHRSAHYHALRRNAADGAWFACVSESARRDLLTVLPQVEPRAVTIPNMVPLHFREPTDGADRVAEIIWSCRNRRAPEQGGVALQPADLGPQGLPYLLMVSTIEPRKNHLAVLEAWERLRTRGHPGLHLVLVGELGWEHEATLDRLRPWLGRGGVHLLGGVPAADLAVLYRHAVATVCPSFAEGFGYSGVEALCCGGRVIASDIAVHREVLADAVEYFSPYSVDDLEAVLHRVTSSGPPIGAAGSAGADHRAAQDVIARFRPDRVLSQWAQFFASLQGRRIGNARLGEGS